MKVTTCKRCLLNVEIDNAVLTETGCNYCDSYVARLDALSALDGESVQNEIAKKIKQAADDEADYDCIIGVSGGTDSSFLVEWAHRNDLKALLVHVDNGWNTELSVKNIEQLSNVTGFPLITIVLNWENFKEIQKSFIRAGLRELEFATDHAIKFGVYATAKKYRIKSILSGRNLVTEGILPEVWSYGPLDKRFLKSVCAQSGVVIDKSFPTQSLIGYLFDRVTKQYQEYFPLNYVSETSVEWKSILTEKYGWVEYKQKHFESTWTKFYQGYWLPKRFKIDKRRAHLSVKLLRGEITKQEALEELETPILPEEYDYTELKYVAEKLEIDFSELVDSSDHSESEVSDFKNNKFFFDFLHTSLYLNIRKYILS